MSRSASGSTCDPNAKACVIYSVDDSGGDGGCGCALPGRSTTTRGLWLATLLALAAARRRARARRSPPAGEGGREQQSADQNIPQKSCTAPPSE